MKGPSDESYSVSNLMLLIVLYTSCSNRTFLTAALKQPQHCGYAFKQVMINRNLLIQQISNSGPGI